MQRISTIDDFNKLSTDDKNRICSYQNNLLTSFCGLDKERILLRGNNTEIFNFYVERTLNKLISFSKLLKLNENSWAEYEEERNRENAESSQYNFDTFFNGFINTIASIELLDYIKPHNLVDYENIKNKLSLIKQNYEVEYQNFLSFHINESKMKTYNLKILTIEEIYLKSKDVISHFQQLKIINLFDPKYRNYLRSRNKTFYRENLYIENNPEFDESIVAIENIIFDTYDSFPNIISSIYKSYFDLSKMYRYMIHCDNTHKTFDNYKQHRISSIKEAYGSKRKHQSDSDKKLMNTELERLDKINLEDIYYSNKELFQKNAINLQALINRSRILLQKVFNNHSSSESILLTLKDSIISTEFNEYKFFAFPDESVKSVSSQAYFGFSVHKSETSFLEQIENLISENLTLAKQAIESFADEKKDLVNGSNFYSPTSLLEEFNSDWVQNYFFKNKEPLSVELATSN